MRVQAKSIDFTNKVSCVYLVRVNSLKNRQLLNHPFDSYRLAGCFRYQLLDLLAGRLAGGLAGLQDVSSYVSPYIFSTKFDVTISVVLLY